MRLYIIRHAQSTNNALQDYAYRVCDPELTDLGRRQAQVLATYLAQGTEPRFDGSAGPGEPGFRFTHLYTSPMRRAIQTVRPVSEAMGLRPKVWVEVHEHGGIFLDHGPERRTVGYPGLTCAEMLAECEGLLLPSGVTERGWWTDGREDWAGCEARALRVAEVLQRRAGSDEHIAIITHGGFLDALLKRLLREPPEDELSYLSYNTAISRLDWEGGDRPEVRYLARVDHLPPRLLS